MSERRESRRPVIAVSVLVFNPEGQVLLGKRIESFGQGMYSLPGGGVSEGESFFEAGERELKEEAGFENGEVTLENFISISYENILGRDGLTVGIKASSSLNPGGGNEEMEDWEWYSLDNLPENLFPPSERILNNYKRGIIRDKALSW